MKKRKIDLAINPGCIGCGKDCNHRAATVSKDFKGSIAKFGCNSSK